MCSAVSCKCRTIACLHQLIIVLNPMGKLLWSPFDLRIILFGCSVLLCALWVMLMTTNNGYKQQHILQLTTNRSLEDVYAKHLKIEYLGGSITCKLNMSMNIMKYS